jgi:hypothetical protein
MSEFLQKCQRNMEGFSDKGFKSYREEALSIFGGNYKLLIVNRVDFFIKHQ